MPSRMCAAVLDGALEPAELGELAVLHLLRRRSLPRQAVHRLGKVVEGMENVDKIKRGEPVRDPDRIVSMKVMADAPA